DLKARLGRTSVVGAGPTGAAVPVPTGQSAPAPMPLGAPESGRPSAPSSSPGSTPAPAPVVPAARPSGGGIAPPPGISPGIPLPPFAPAARQAQAAPKPTAQAQTIKVEIGEEVEQERKKAAKRTAIYAAIAAVVGLGVGFVAGGSKEKGDRAKMAFDGAAALEKDVKTADDKMKELDEKITAGQKELSEKKFPTDLVTQLGAINIPFDAMNLENKQVGSLPGKVLRMVLGYTSAVQQLNKEKDALKNVLGAAQGSITKAWKEEKEPPTNFAVLFVKNGDKLFGELTPVKEPFPFSAKDWPGKITVTKIEGRKPVEKQATRFSGGGKEKADFGGETALVVPVEPQSVAQFTTDAIAGKLAKAIYDVREALEGKKDDPTHETAGLIKDGDDLANELHKIALQR
ncbi:MAG TPA: hypothetical protein VHB21_26345, partial [Minicystis sp.]|nr:hypothetical protein [Minicystis sp.]